MTRDSQQTTRVYYDADADLEPVRSRRIAIVGYGNQGHAHALNLRDSGCEVRVGARPGGQGWDRASAAGFEVAPVEDACRWADLVSVLLPDQDHRRVFQESILPQLGAGKLLMMAHGFSIRFGQIRPPPDVDTALVAPVGPGHILRRLYLEGSGIPAVFAVHQSVTGRAEEVALSYARGLGCTRAGVLATTFQEETETDLFGEQAVLCGGLTALMKAGFETLVAAGYQPELAFFECIHQVKLIVDLIYEGGFTYMHERISDTAEFGDRVAGPRVVDEGVRRSLEGMLQDIQDGT
ncbi:MAG: ketol-acid reductoisomerase, partial [Chloroflexi bacterium]|nr:ketol-acid reductoisomerase [Chloroflexota bacterium]